MINSLKRKRPTETFIPHKRSRSEVKSNSAKREAQPYSFGFEVEMFHAGIARVNTAGWQLAPLQTILSNPYVRANRDRNFTGQFSQAFRADLREDGITIFDDAWKSMPRKMQRLMNALPPINILELNTTPSMMPRDALKESSTESFISAFDRQMRNAVLSTEQGRISFKRVIESFNRSQNAELATRAGEGAEDLYLISGDATKTALNTSSEPTYYPQINFSVTWESFGNSEPGAVLEHFMQAFSQPPRRKSELGAEQLMPHSRGNAEQALEALRASKQLQAPKLLKLRGFLANVALMACTGATKGIAYGGTPKNKYHFLPKNKPSDLLANTLSARDKELLSKTTVDERASIVAALARGLRNEDLSHTEMFQADGQPITAERFIRSALGWSEPDLADKLFSREGVRFLPTQPEIDLGYSKRKQPLSRPIFEARNLIDLRMLGSVFEMTRAAKEELPFFNQTSKSRFR